MAKNYVKRVVATGSAVALGAAALVAAPAQAVDDLNIALAAGTSFNSVTGYANEIQLNTSIAAAYSSADTSLAYRIVNSGEADVQVQLGYTSATATNKVDNTVADAYEYGKTAVLADSDASNKTFNKKDVVVDIKATAQGDYTKTNIIGVGVKDATEKDYTVTVQAWLDLNENRKIDSTEVVSNIITINFYDETHVSATAAVVSPVNGADNVKVNITTTPELNGEQLGADFLNAKVTAQGNGNATFVTNTLKSDGTAGSTTYDADTKTWTATAYLGWAKPANPWNGSAVTVAQEDLTDTDGSSTAAVYYSTTTSAIITASVTGAAAGQLVKIANVANVAGDSVDDTQLNGVFTTKATTNSTTTVTLDGTFAAAGSSGSEVTLAAGTLDVIGVPSAQQTVTAGTYSADAYIGTTTKLVAASAAGVATPVAADIKASIAGSDDFTGGKNETAATPTAISVRKGFTGNIPVTATIYKSTGAVAANVAVQVTASSLTGTTYVDGTKLSAGKVVTLTADANGVVNFNVSSTTAAASDAVTLTITSEGTSGSTAAAYTFTWAAATYALWDLKDLADNKSNLSLKRTVDKGGSYTFNLALMDQFGDYLASNIYRYKVVTAGNTAGTNTYVLDADGVTEVTVTDQQLVGGGGTITVDVSVEKLVSGAWTASNGLSASSNSTLSWATNTAGYQHTIVVQTAATEAVALNESGSNTLGGSNADLDGAITTTALANVDNRIGVKDFTTAGSTNVSGVVRNATTLAAVAGAEVTISGPSYYYFKQGGKIASGSLTFIASASGTFDVVVYSNVIAKDQELTVTSMGASKTIKVKFTTGVAADSGTSISIDAPEYVKPGSTLSFTVAVLDDFGNKVDSDQNASNAAGAATVDAGDATYKIVYTGPGLIVGTAPKDVKESSADGDTFNILLGSNDSGTITIAVSYDQNGDKDFTDVNDIVKTVTITIGTAPTVDAGDAGVVNAGSFNGYVAVFAKGYNGSRLSWKIAGKWFSTNVNKDYAVYQRKTVAVGMDVIVSLYIDGKLELTKTVTTR